MKLKIKQPPTVHTELAPSLGWSVWNELFSCSDDQTLHKWNMQGEPEGKVGAVTSCRPGTCLPLYPCKRLILGKQARCTGAALCYSCTLVHTLVRCNLTITPYSACRCANWMPTSLTCTGTR